MKIFIKSCHASLEYDQARMFHDMGYEVYGNWDIGSMQRKKIKGVTDINSNPDDFENIIMHQCENFDLVMEEYLKKGKRVILNVFGQGCDRQHENVSAICRKYPYAFVSTYSIKEYGVYIKHGCPVDKIKMIRFSKYLDDFSPWKGTWPLCYISCNSIHRRGDGCGWEILKEIEEKGLPIILGGNETAENTEFGIGEIPEIGMRNIYRHAMCHLHLGTKPAPITLTLIEAFCSGIPVVANNNNCGLTEEGFELTFYDDVNGLSTEIKKMLTNESYRKEQHLKSIKNAENFDVKIISIQWKELLERLI